MRDTNIRDMREALIQMFSYINAIEDQAQKRSYISDIQALISRLDVVERQEVIPVQSQMKPLTKANSTTTPKARRESTACEPGWNFSDTNSSIPRSCFIPMTVEKLDPASFIVGSGSGENFYKFLREQIENSESLDSRAKTFRYSTNLGHINDLPPKRTLAVRQREPAELDEVDIEKAIFSVLKEYLKMM
jgi:hypothetical protein